MHVDSTTDIARAGKISLYETFKREQVCNLDYLFFVKYDLCITRLRCYRVRDRDLYESLDATLWSLGEEKRNLVISTLEANGIPFRPSGIDIRSIDRILFELFGVGSDALMIEAYGRLNKKLLIGFDDSQIGNAVDKIRKWIEITNEATGRR